MSKRMCFAVFVDQFNEHGYIPSVVTEGEAGHSPLIGKGELARPWYWSRDFEQAKQTCAEENARLGLSEDDVRDIITSSMAAGNEQAAHLNEAGLGHDDRARHRRWKLLQDGTIS